VPAVVVNERLFAGGGPEVLVVEKTVVVVVVEVEHGLDAG